MSLVVTILLAAATVVHLGLGLFLLAVWLRQELIPSDKSIVAFWVILSILTAGVCGAGTIYLAELSGLLEALK